VVAKVRERLSVSKPAAQNFGMERFNLKKLNDEAIKELLTNFVLFISCIVINQT
jgi:hypothetical protein